MNPSQNKNSQTPGDTTVPVIHNRPDDSNTSSISNGLIVILAIAVIVAIIAGLAVGKRKTKGLNNTPPSSSAPR